MGVTRGRASDSGRVVFGRYGVLWTRQGQRFLIAAALAVLGSALLLLADAAGAFPASLLPHTPLHAGKAHAAAIIGAQSGTPTTPTATTPPPPPQPPVVTLISPSTGQGPIGAHVTISGHNFSGSSATIFASGQPDCSGSLGTLATPKVSGGNVGTTTFIWPTNLGNGAYYICAEGLTSGAPSYQVVGSGSPTLSLSVSTAAPGDSVTVAGSNFAGYPAGTTIYITESASGSPRTLTLTSAALGGDGTFSVAETLSKDIVGNNVTINAYSQSDGSGIQPALQASASLTVQAVTPTATVIVTPTQSTLGGITSTGKSANDHSGSTGLIVVLIVGIVLALLVILGVVAYLVLRGRNGGEPGAGGDYAGGGGFGGYGGASGPRATGPVPGYGQMNQYGRSGVFDTPNAYTEPYAGLPVGGVSQWDDSEPTPGPDWQPRPMTGYGQADGDMQTLPPGQYPDYPGGAPQQQGGKGTYPPVDPWDAPTNQPQQPGRSSGAGYAPNSNLGGITGRTRATGSTGAAPQPRPQSEGWGDGPGDGGWGGSGATRPGVNGPNQWDKPAGNEPGW